MGSRGAALLKEALPGPGDLVVATGDPATTLALKRMLNAEGLAAAGALRGKWVRRLNTHAERDRVAEGQAVQAQAQHVQRDEGEPGRSAAETGLLEATQGTPP